MRFLTAITVGVVTSALVLAACSGDQPPTSPNVAPSFSSLSTGASYTVTFTCNAAASNNSVAYLSFYNGTTLRNSYGLYCGDGVSALTGVDNFTYDILLINSTSNLIRQCSQHQATITRDGQFSCNRAGLKAVLTVAPE
jgi:hypothetical protein